MFVFCECGYGYLFFCFEGVGDDFVLRGCGGSLFGLGVCVVGDVGGGFGFCSEELGVYVIEVCVLFKEVICYLWLVCEVIEIDYGLCMGDCFGLDGGGVGCSVGGGNSVFGWVGWVGVFVGNIYVLFKW